MHIKNPLLLPIISHGATDIIDAPLPSITLNILSSLIFINIKPINRKMLLILSSIFHMGNDFIGKYKYLYSGLMHLIWLKKPIISVYYLSLIHTPLHIKRQQLMKKNIIIKYGIIILTNAIAYYTINNNYYKNLDILLGEYWWVSPVLIHIYMTEIIKRNFITNYNINKLYYRLFNKIYYS